MVVRAGIEERSRAAGQFVACAQAVERWDPLLLRQLWRLPSEIPLELIADLLARLHHLQPKTDAGIQKVLESARIWPWLQGCENLDELRAMLPAVYAYVAAVEPEPGRR